MNDHRLDKFLKEHYLSSLFEPNANNLCNNYDEDSYGNLKMDELSHLDIFAWISVAYLGTQANLLFF